MNAFVGTYSPRLDGKNYCIDLALKAVVGLAMDTTVFDAPYSTEGMVRIHANLPVCLIVPRFRSYSVVEP